MTGKIKHFGHEDSGHAFKVAMMLNIADIPHDYERVDIWQPRTTRSAEFQNKSKFQQVPLLTHGDQAIIQSGAILYYLAQFTHAYGFETTVRQYQVQQWLMWEANRINMCVPQIRYKHAFNPQAFDDSTELWLSSRYNEDILILENELADGRDFILDDVVSIADFALSGYLFYIKDTPLKIPTAVQAWLDRIQNLKGWGTPKELLGA